MLSNNNLLCYELKNHYKESNFSRKVVEQSLPSLKALRSLYKKQIAYHFRDLRNIYFYFWTYTAKKHCSHEKTRMWDFLHIYIFWVILNSFALFLRWRMHIKAVWIKSSIALSTTNWHLNACIFYFLHPKTNHYFLLFFILH